ncbi:MAG: nucleoside deaminase [Mycoplasmatota bacterium]
MCEKYMKIALKEAKKAYKNKEIPIGAVIIKDNKVISKAHNLKNSKNIVTKHAEIIAIEKACKKLKSWRLIDCELYVTLEPCMMCTGAIHQSKIKKVYYSLDSEKFGFLKKFGKVPYEKGILEEESLKLLNSFFLKKRI